MFLSANVGVGHISAAKAICAALEERDPAVHTRIVDSYKYAALVVSGVVSEGYLQMVKSVPQLYRYIYRQAERATAAGPFRAWAHQFTAGNLRSLIEREKPDAVVCTHAFPCGAMAEYKKLYPDAPPVLGVVTDFAVHAYWMQKNIEGFAVATEDMRARMIARGIAPERIHVTGIPVHPHFAEPALPHNTLRKELGLPLDRHIVLIMGGGLGMGPIVKMMHALEESEIPVCAVVITGRNTRLETRVRAAADALSYPVHVLRFVDNVDAYMHAADILLTKPGGLTTAEALIAGIPMVLFKPLPGQEERNVRYLIEQQAAVRAGTNGELVGTLRELLLDAGRRERMMQAMREIAKPRAAEQIALAIEALAQPKEVLT